MLKPTDQSNRCAVTGEAAKLSVLVSCACVLQVAETLLPYPLPGLRLGLANMITLVALVDISARSAFKIAVLRTVISSMILGTFLTPSFVLSFSGSLVSAAVMVLFYKLATRRLPFSLIGISVAGSVAHVVTQILLVYLLFVRSRGVLALWPWLALSGVVMGVVTGIVAIQVVRRLGGGQEGLRSRATNPAPVATGSQPLISPSGRFVDAGTAVHRLPAELKILFVLAVAVAVVLFRNYAFYLGVLAFLIAVAVVSRVRFGAMFYNLRRLSALLAFSVAMPVVFAPAGRVLYTLGPVKITEMALASGGAFAMRIVLLVLATSLLALTTSPVRIAAGLERLLRPLSVFGVSSGRLADSLGLAWTVFPVLWQRAQALVRNTGGERRSLKKLLLLLTDLVAGLYLHAEELVPAYAGVAPRTERESTDSAQEGREAKAESPQPEAMPRAVPREE